MRREHELGLGDQQQRRRRTAGPISWPISRTAPNRPLAALRLAGVTTAGSSAQVAGRSSALPRPAASASATSGDRAVGEDEAGEGERADQLGGDRAAEPAGAVDQPAEQRAEQHRGGEVGDQHRGRAPGRAELLVGQQQQRDVAGAGAERALEVGGEEPARAALGAPAETDWPLDCMAACSITGGYAAVNAAVKPGNRGVWTPT